MNIGIAVNIVTRLKDKINEWAKDTKKEAVSRGRIHAPKSSSPSSGPVINRKTTIELTGITVIRADGTVEEIR